MYMCINICNFLPTCIYLYMCVCEYNVGVGISKIHEPTPLSASGVTAVDNINRDKCVYHGNICTCVLTSVIYYVHVHIYIHVCVNTMYV